MFDVGASQFTYLYTLFYAIVYIENCKKKKCTSEYICICIVLLYLVLLSFLVYWRSLAFTIWTTASCILFCVLPEERKLNEWNDMKLNKLWQIFHFGGNCSFREIMYLNIFLILSLFSHSHLLNLLFLLLSFLWKEDIFKNLCAVHTISIVTTAVSVKLQKQQKRNTIKAVGIWLVCYFPSLPKFLFNFVVKMQVVT